MTPDFPGDNFLSQLNTTPSPGSIIDVEMLDSGDFLALFQHWLKFITSNGDVLSSFKLQKKAISLGRFKNEFVIPCYPKTLCFIKITDSNINLYKVMNTEIQFSGACAMSTDSLACVAENEPTIYVYNGRVCTRTIDLTSYGMDVPHCNSSRRIRLNKSGHIVISDYENEFVVILLNNCTDSVTHYVDCPSNISACEKFVYIVQGAHENSVLEVSLADHSKLCILEEEDGIVDPSCVSVNKYGKMMVGMKSSEPVARGYQLGYDVQ